MGFRSPFRRRVMCGTGTTGFCRERTGSACGILSDFHVMVAPVLFGPRVGCDVEGWRPCQWCWRTEYIPRPMAPGSAGQFLIAPDGDGREEVMPAHRYVRMRVDHFRGCRSRVMCANMWRSGPDPRPLVRPAPLHNACVHNAIGSRIVRTWQAIGGAVPRGIREIWLAASRWRLRHRCMRPPAPCPDGG